MRTNHQCWASFSRGMVEQTGESQTKLLFLHLGGWSNPRREWKMNVQLGCTCGHTDNNESIMEIDWETWGCCMQKDKVWGPLKVEDKEYWSSGQDEKATNLIEGKCLMTTSRAWMVSKGIFGSRPDNASCRDCRFTQDTHLIATLKLRSFPSPGIVTSNST